MPIDCEPISPSAEAVDVFATDSAKSVKILSFSFGTASPSKDDFSDILRSPEAVQEVLDILDG